MTKQVEARSAAPFVHDLRCNKFEKLLNDCKNDVFGNLLSSSFSSHFSRYASMNYEDQLDILVSRLSRFFDCSFSSSCCYLQQFSFHISFVNRKERKRSRASFYRSVRTALLVTSKRACREQGTLILLVAFLLTCCLHSLNYNKTI